MMIFISLLFKWPHLSLTGMDHLTSLSMESRVRKSTKAQISNKWLQTIQPKQRKKGRQPAGGWCLTMSPLPSLTSFCQVLSALWCSILSSNTHLGLNITDGKIEPHRSDLVMVLVPEPSLVLELPAEKSLIVLPREIVPYTGAFPRAREENVRPEMERIEIKSSENLSKPKTHAESGINRELFPYLLLFFIWPSKWGCFPRCGS